MYLYILDTAGGLYVGITNNLSRRLKQHASGQCVTTRRMLPVRLRKHFHMPDYLYASKCERWLHRRQRAGGDKAVLSGIKLSRWQVLAQLLPTTDFETYKTQPKEN